MSALYDIQFPMENTLKAIHHEMEWDCKIINLSFLKTMNINSSPFILIGTTKLTKFVISITLCPGNKNNVLLKFLYLTEIIHFVTSTQMNI